MSKRRSEYQITQLDPNAARTGDDEADGQQQASEEQMRKRKIVRVKRKGEKKESSESGSGPSFNFGVAQEEKKSEQSSATVHPAFAKFLNNSNWECPACLLSNKEDALKCIACETDNPNKKPSTKEETKGDSETKEEKGVSFTFGAPPASGTDESAKTGDKPAFTFGGGDNNFSFTSNGATPFTFSTNSNMLSFSSVAGEKSEGFGSKSTQAEFELANSSTLSKEQKTNSAFKEEKPNSGEEHDEVVMNARCKVFTLEESQPEPAEDSEDKPEKEKKEPVKKWKERGVGDLHINLCKPESKATAGRLVMRVDKTFRLVLNVPIFKGMKFNQQDEKYVNLVSYEAETADKADLRSFLLRFKTKSVATEAVAAIQKVIAQLPK